MDKQDKRDVGIRDITLEREEDDEEAAEIALANLNLLQRTALDEMIASGDNEVAEADRSVMETCLEMTHTEFALLETLIILIRVYDHARSSQPLCVRNLRTRSQAILECHKNSL